MDNLFDTKVSLFDNFFDTDPVARPLRDVIRLMKSDDIKNITLEIRRQRAIVNDENADISSVMKAKEKADNLKRKLPSFLTDVVCEHGKNRQSIKYFLPTEGFDVDHLKKEQVIALIGKLRNNEHVVLAEPSCSYTGVHFVVLTDAAEWLSEKWDGKNTKPYEFAWQKVREYVESTFEVEIDPNCKNPEQIFTISYEEELVYYNENAKPLHIDTADYSEPAAKIGRSFTPTLRCGNYQASIYDVADSIICKIEQSGYYFTEGSRNDFVTRFAFYCNKYGVSQTETENYCKTNFEQSDFKEKEILASIRSAYKNTAEHGILYATYANTPNATNIENIQKTTISGTFDYEPTDGAMAETAEDASDRSNGYTFSDKLNVDDLNDLMQTVFNLHSKDVSLCDAQLLGVLNIIGGMMGGTNGTVEAPSGVYGIYDGRTVFPPTFNIVYSSAGNSKGNLTFCKLLMNQVRSEMCRQYNAEQKQYEQDMTEWETKSKKERGAAPMEPVYRDPFVPGNSSSSAVYRQLDANGGWAMMFETEADTVSYMLDSDYGNYSDLMRKAHHHETLSMSRVTDKVHISIEQPRLSILLTCTSGQLASLFPTFENGLGSRFLFYYINDKKMGFKDVFAMTDSPYDVTYKKLGEKLMPLYSALKSRVGHPIQFVMSQNQQKEFIKTYSGVLQEQFNMLGKGIRAFVFRIALENFRYAMILTTLRRLCEWQKTFDASNPEQNPIFLDEENALVCDDRDFRTAMTFIGCLINHTARVYSVLAKDDNNPFAERGIKLKKEEQLLYQLLPVGEFPTALFLGKASELNIPERTAQRILSLFSNKYQIITPVRRGVYRKELPSNQD